MLESDRALLESFRRGERDALTRIFRHFADDVASTLRAGVIVDVDGQKTRVGARLPEHELEGLIHETFARAFSPNARASYDGLRPYGAWLGTIARNLLVDRARKVRKDARVTAVEDIGAIADAEAPDPTWRIEQAQIDDVLASLRSGLEEPDLSIFRLRFEEQLSFRDTATALGLTEIVVRRRDTRLRAKILTMLRERGFLENARVRIGTSLLPRRKQQTG